MLYCTFCYAFTTNVYNGLRCPAYTVRIMHNCKTLSQNFRVKLEAAIGVFCVDCIYVHCFVLCFVFTIQMRSVLTVFILRRSVRIVALGNEKDRLLEDGQHQSSLLWTYLGRSAGVHDRRDNVLLSSAPHTTFPAFTEYQACVFGDVRVVVHDCPSWVSSSCFITTHLLRSYPEGDAGGGRCTHVTLGVFTEIWRSCLSSCVMTFGVSFTCI